MHARKRYTFAVMASLAAMTAFLVACSSNTSSHSNSSSGKLIPVTFELEYQPVGANAGFEVAAAEGYYRAEGLNVKLEPGNGSSLVSQLVGNGKVPLGYSDATTTAQVIAKGAPIKVVATIEGVSGNEIASLKSSGITKISQLKGKTLITPTGSGETVILPLVLAHAGLKPAEIDIINVPLTAVAPDLLLKRSDAVVSAIGGPSLQAEMQGAVVNHMTYAENGAATVGNSIIVNTNYLAKNQSVVRKFILASLKGWNLAIANPQRAAVDLTKVFPNMTTSAKEVEVGLKDLLDSKLYCWPDQKYMGLIPEDDWARSVKLSSSVGILPKNVPAADYYTNAYLPKGSESPAKCPGT